MIRNMVIRLAGTFLLAVGLGGYVDLTQKTAVAQAPPAAPDGRPIELRQSGVQTVSLKRFPTDSQKASHISGVIKLDRGGLTATLVLRMLGRDGVDLAPQAKLMGFADPTREFAIKGMKAGTPVQIEEDFVSGLGAASVQVELRAQVTSAPCSLTVESLAIKDRAGGTTISEQDQPGDTLITTPHAGFAYGQNLVPPLDSEQWKATGNATRGKAMAGQTTLVLSDSAPGKWESPIVPLARGSRQIYLQAFFKFDAQATPVEHPFDVIFRDANGKTIPLPGNNPRWWRWQTWYLSYGKWIPVTIDITPPEQAVSVQIAMELRALPMRPWYNAQPRNNFGTFQAATLRLWSSAEVAADSKNALAGNAASVGPFAPCATLQENSVVLSTNPTTAGNLAFGSPQQWPAPRAWVENYLPTKRSLVLKGDVFDWMGQKVGSVSCPVQLAPYEKKDVELPVVRPGKAGVYSTNLDAQQGGALVGQDVIRWGYFFHSSDRADRHDEQYPFFFHPLFTADDNSVKEPADLKREIQILRALGVRGVRLQCRLWSFDPAQPDAGIPGIQQFAADYYSQIEPFVRQGDLETYISFFPRPSAPVPTSERDLAKWREYMAATVKAYPTVTTFVFGNEEVGGRHKSLDARPRIWGYEGSMREFITQFKEARKASLQARPNLIFIPGQASDPQGTIARLFFEGGGTLADLQGWAANAYNTPGPTFAKISEILQSNGADVSKFTGIIPEIGYDRPPKGPRRLAGEKVQAQAVLGTYMEVLSAVPWVKYITYFAVVHACGAGENHGVFDADWSPKPAAGAYLCMTQTLGAGRPTRVTQLPETTAYLWQRPDGSKVGVLWRNEAQKLRVRVGDTDGPVIIRDFMGNDVAVRPQSGMIEVQVSDSPIYLLNIKTLGT